MAQFEAIQKLLDSYDIGEWICGICFDTTASILDALEGLARDWLTFMTNFPCLCWHADTMLEKSTYPTSIPKLLVTEPLDQKTNCSSL